MKDLDDKTKAKLIIQLAALASLVALAAIDAFSPDFTVNQVVYAIIGGILFGVGGVKELIGGVSKTKEKSKDDEK